MLIVWKLLLTLSCRLLGDGETEFDTKIKMTAGWKEMMVLFVALSCDPLWGVSVLGFSSLSLSGPSGPAARGWNNNWTHKQICFSVGNTHMMRASTFVFCLCFFYKEYKADDRIHRLTTETTLFWCCSCLQCRDKIPLLSEITVKI